MVQFAPVCPIRIYEAMEKFDDDNNADILGDYFLLLAHDVLKDAKRYEAFFKERGCTIIMDNSVIELGEACTAENLLEAASIVGATCLAIPDVLQNGSATVTKARNFQETVDAINRPCWDGDLMFIPQGKDANDFYLCFEAALAAGIPMDWIGIPRNLPGRVFPSRMFPATYCYYRSKGLPNIHLLGFADGHLADDILTCKQFNSLVVGIDSAAPLRLGSLPYEHLSTLEPRGSWWDTCQFDDQMAKNLITVRKEFR